MKRGRHEPYIEKCFYNLSELDSALAARLECMLKLLFDLGFNLGNCQRRRNLPIIRFVFHGANKGVFRRCIHLATFFPIGEMSKTTIHAGRHFGFCGLVELRVF